MSRSDETPLMKQYYAVKSKYPDAILLFRVGDFYETFGEDAVLTSKILGIVLTKRANGSSHIELAGFPFHAVDTYLPKLVKAGHRVAICEQLEDPKKTKKIVKRGVTEMVSPGTSINEKILDHKQNNFLASVYMGHEKTGISFVDISTGEFLIAEGSVDYIENLMNSFKPSEVIYSKTKQIEFKEYFSYNQYSFLVEDWLYNFEFAYDKLLNHFQTHNLKGFGIEDMKAGICAAGVIMHYLSENKYDRLQHISKINRIEISDYIWLDKFTVRNLEIFQPIQVGGTSLIDVIDKTQTPMGGRLLKKWIGLPLKDLRKINERHDVVEFFFLNPEISDHISTLLSQFGDLERLISRAALRKINPRELRYIYNSLDLVGKLKTICSQSTNNYLSKYSERFNTCLIIKEKIGSTIVDDPPIAVNKGDIIKTGVSEELDSLRNLKSNSKSFLLNLKESEIAKTGISSLKIGYTSVFGYYFEVTNTHKNKVPGEWLRKQTLVNAERYITPELKEYEEKILTAEEKIAEIENNLYQDLLSELSDYVGLIQENSNMISQIDCLVCFASVARNYNYTRPEINDSLLIEIQEGRHPVIEQKLPESEKFIPNDIYLNNQNQQIIILTGPNMSGKSAVLRQTAIIVLLAHIGSFVPAKKAKIGFVDKIFTRVGASDNLSVGESTFMVEMLETASILNNLSERSLILLDEIGRGTSTYDGISLAWAITEFLHQHEFQPKTIFATHYHELNEIATALKRVRNFNIKVKEFQNKIIFLRKLEPGTSEHSFGIHVAHMAGIPGPVTERAKEILDKLEQQRENIKNASQELLSTPVNIQLKMFETTDEVYELVRKEISKMDINSLTPIEALMKLNQLKALIKKEGKS